METLNDIGIVCAIIITLLIIFIPKGGKLNENRRRD